jgi:hypothetical protein
MLSLPGFTFDNLVIVPVNGVLTAKSTRSLHFWRLES